MATRVSALFVHPVKAARAVPVREACLVETGLEHDREFCVVDERGSFLTQREHSELARLDARVEGGELVLIGDDLRPVRVPIPPRGDKVKATVWGDEVEAVDCGPEAAGLLTNHLGRIARLVRMADGFVRPVDAGRGRPGDRVAFADGFPVLVATAAAVVAVNARLERAVDMRRFRPNVVVEGAAPFEEDEWATLRVGEAELDLVKPCSRCLVVDVDPDTGRRGKDVLAALAAFRADDKRVLFGQNAIPRRLGTIRVGDPVEIVARRAG